MNVCLLTPEFGPRWGGVGTYSYNLAQGLRDRARVHVVTAGHGRENGALAPPEGVELHEIGARRPRPDTLGLGFQLAVFRRLPALARTHRFDIIHANHAYMSDLLVRLRQLRGATAVTVHTTLGTQIEGTMRAGGLAPLNPKERTIARWRHVFRRIERRYLRKTASMIFVSRYVRDHAVARYHLRPRVSEVIPNGVDTARLGRVESSLEALGLAHDGPTLLFAGRLLALKGIDTLLRAMAKVDPSVRLLLAGPGDPAPWRALADRLDLDGRVIFLGPVPPSEMPGLYRHADAVVLPSFSESCSMVALEAMASGTPLIAAAAGGVVETVHHGVSGWLFPPGDVDALVDRIGDVLSDPARAEAVAARARDWVDENGSIDRMAERTLHFYEAVAGGEA